MERLTRYLKTNGAKITSRRVSFKLNSDGTYSSDRSIYRIEPSNDSIVRGVISLFTSDRKMIDFIARRNNEDKGEFGVLFDEDSVRFYIDSPFEYDSDAIYSIQIKKDKSVKRIYRMSRISDMSIFNQLSGILEYLNLDYMISRNDGQKYLRFKHNEKIPSEIMETITTNEVMKQWIREHSETCIPVWIQISENSISLYYKFD